MIRDQVFSNFELRNTMNLPCRLTFYFKKDRPVPWVSLVCFHVNLLFEGENVHLWSPVKSPLETCFLEVEAYMYVR